MAASAAAFLLSVAVARDAAASSLAQGLRQTTAIGATENDGSNNASADNYRADEPDKGRTDRSLHGRVSIGTTASVATLDVYKGEVKVGSSEAACTEV
jgi:hypothetical protein